MRAFALALLLALTVPASAGAMGWQSPRWTSPPDYTFTVPPYGGVAVIPAGVCPVGISDLAATRGRREFPAPRVDTLAFARPRLIVNGYHRTLRGYVWCG